MSETQTIVAIAVPAFVAIVTVAANVYLAYRQSADARRLADIDAARALLDEAGQLFHEVGYALGGSMQLYLQWGEDFASDAEKGRDEYTKLETLGVKCDRMNVRLQTRLGPDHPAAEHFKTANGAVLGAFRKLGRAKQAAKRNQDADQWDEIQVDRTLFQHEADKFVLAAHQAAGVKLPRK